MTGAPGHSLSQASAEEQFLSDAKITHMAVGAHQDDIEVMASDGIKKCFEARAFGAIICTDGAGSPRQGPYADFTNDQMVEERKREQRAAAQIGQYGYLAQLAFSSSSIKSGVNPSFLKDLKGQISRLKPQVIYTHSFADKHQTHVGVAAHVLLALRDLGRDFFPDEFYGCEVWRNLDWMPDSKKVAFDISGFDQKVAELIRVFESQTVGGKRYDLATVGRMLSNATFFESHNTDRSEHVLFAMDLKPLLEKDVSPTDYVSDLIDEFRQEVTTALKPWESSWK